MEHCSSIQGAADCRNCVCNEKLQSVAWKVEIREQWCEQESILGARGQPERGLCEVLALGYKAGSWCSRDSGTTQSCSLGVTILSWISGKSMQGPHVRWTGGGGQRD